MSLRHRAETRAVVALRAVAGWLPDPAAAGLGAALGRAFYAIDGTHRRLAVRQLQAAFPFRSARECRAIARATFAHFGRALVALLKFSTLTPDEIGTRVEYEGESHMWTALAGGKGVLMVSGHFGYWELQGLAHPLRFPPMSVVVRPLDNPDLDERLDGIRRATGNKIISRRGAVRRVLRGLAAGECVAIMIEQHIQAKDAVAVEFFGRSAATTTALAALALRTGAPIVPVFALPLPGGRYRMIYEHPIERPATDSPDPVRELTQRCTDVLEMYVRRYPHLWLWLHRRWRDDDVEPGRADAVPTLGGAGDREGSRG